MALHGLGIAAEQDEAGANAASGTDGTEDIGRLGALIAGRPGPGSPLRPAPRDLVLLADPGFILPPKLYLGAGRKLCSDRCQFGGETFLKSSRTGSFCARCCRRAEILTKPSAFSSRLTVLSSSETRNSSQSHCTRSFKRQKRPALGLGQLGRGAGRLAVDQTIEPFSIETQNPIANDLKPNTANRRRRAATATLVNHRQGKQAARLIGIPRDLRKPPKPRAVIVLSQCDRCCHGNPPSLYHGESHRAVTAQHNYESDIPQIGIKPYEMRN
jgi:hypothetical protein